MQESVNENDNVFHDLGPNNVLGLVERTLDIYLSNLFRPPSPLVLKPSKSI